jgi:hypothetical protein
VRTCSDAEHTWIAYGSYRRADGSRVGRMRCRHCGCTKSDATGNGVAGMRVGREVKDGVVRWTRFWTEVGSRVGTLGLPGAVAAARRQTDLESWTVSRWVRDVVDQRRTPAVELLPEVLTALRIRAGYDASTKLDLAGSRPDDAFLALIREARAIACLVTGLRFPGWLDWAVGSVSPSAAGKLRSGFLPGAAPGGPSGRSYEDDRPLDSGLRYVGLWREDTLVLEVRTRKRVVGRAETRMQHSGLPKWTSERWFQFDRGTWRPRLGAAARELTVPVRRWSRGRWKAEADLTLKISARPTRRLETPPDQLSLFM